LDLDSHRQDGTGRDTVGQGGVPGYLSMKHGIVFRAGMMGNVMMPPHSILFVGMIVGGRGHDRDYD
jgi:hypothetical protein